MSVLNCRWSLLLVVAAVVPAQAPPRAATAPNGLTVEQALQLRYVTNPQFGDDFVAFTQVVPRPLADGPGGARQHVGVIDGLTKLAKDARPEPKWLVAGKDTAPAMAVRPGAREVSFVRAADGVPQVFVLPIDGGEAKPFAKTPAVSAYRWRPDGKAIAFTSLDAMPDDRAAARARGFQPVVVDEDWRHLSLWIVEDGGEAKKVTSDVTVFDHQWSPDGSKIACAVAPKNTVDDSYMFARLKVLDVASRALTKLVDNPGKLGSFAWSPNGEQIAFITAADRNDPHAGAIAFVDVRLGEWRFWPRAFVSQAGSFSEIAWRGSELLAVDHVGVRSGIHPSQGMPARIHGSAIPRGHVTAFTVKDEWIAATIGAAEHPPELFLCTEVASVKQPKGGTRIRLTDSNPELANVELGDQTIETVRARDGLEIEGILIKPVGYEPGTKYPFVIVVHGGPEAHFSDGWLTSYGNWGQLLAARGYVSWYPNYRSSTGYGTAFAKHDHGDPMGKEFSDHIDAIEHFARMGLVDRERTGIGGGSYGGYTAAWAATKHSEHFAAAVSFVPFVDLRTKWLTSDIPYEFYHVHYQEQWPWQQPGLMADRSPLSWVTNCKTPLLVLGGTNDTRVHNSQPFMLYRAVKFATDTPTRYVQYPGEGHGNRTNVYQYDFALRTLEWLDHYLQGDGDRRKKPLPPMDVAYPK